MTLNRREFVQLAAAMVASLADGDTVLENAAAGFGTHTAIAFFGRHISYAQLAHAIDSLDQHHPALNQGQVLLLLAPEKPVRVRPGNI